MFTEKKTPAKIALIAAMDILLHKKSFHKISVNELCECANISRSAFYTNFEDKYQLLSYCLHDRSGQLNRLMETRSPEEFMTVILNYIQEEKRLFHNLFASDLSEEIVDILYQFFDEYLTQILIQKESEGLILSGPIDTVSAFYIGGLTAMVLHWIKTNYRMPKEELAACMNHLLKEITQ